MRHNRGFTLIELLVVIAIIAILAAILFPVFAKARDKARSANCISNLKQLALVIRLYCDDYDDAGPFTYMGYGCEPGGIWVWNRMINSGYGPAGESGMYSCPGNGSYGMNRYRGAFCARGVAGGNTDPWRLDGDVRHPEAVMLIADAWYSHQCDPPYFYDVNGDGKMTPRHGSVDNMAFCDGHVKGVTPDWLYSKIVDQNGMWFRYWL